MVLAQNQRWYLGLDLSEAHVAATLLDRATEITYPLHWQIKNHPPIYRFPSAVYFEGKTPDNDNGLFCIGLDAIRAAQEKQGEGALFIEQFLSYFNLCIPYFESEEHQWQPKLAYRDRQTIPLYWLQKCLQAIVSTLQV
ncbi:MAG: hypothetical protein HC796_10465, partial [Synechococcaceae cyanobacterium RL_1_2]|nr:hypothetical protein [Synechococcaceae cyanobacterium RL_1_2]